MRPCPVIANTDPPDRRGVSLVVLWRDAEIARGPDRDCDRRLHPQRPLPERRRAPAYAGALPADALGRSPRLAGMAGDGAAGPPVRGARKPPGGPCAPGRWHLSGRLGQRARTRGLLPLLPPSRFTSSPPLRS